MKRTKTLVAGAMALAAGVSSCLLLAFAQDNQGKSREEISPKKAEGSAPFAQRVFPTRPDLNYVAKVSFKLPSERERVQFVVPQLKGSPLFVPGLFFCTPEFSHVENGKPPEGFPSIVQGAEKEPDGSTTLYFKTILYSDRGLEVARKAVLHQDTARKIWTKEGWTEDDIRVKPWPIVHAIIALVDYKKNRNLLRLPKAKSAEAVRSNLGFAWPLKNF